MGDQVEREKPVAPKDVFSPVFNQVDDVDQRTDTTGVGPQPSNLQNEGWPARGDGRLTLPAGSTIEADGQVFRTNGKGDIYVNANTVNIYNGDGRGTVAPQVVVAEDYGDRLGSSGIDLGHSQIGRHLYRNPHSYSEMMRNGDFDRPQVVVRADIGHHGSHHRGPFRHPQYNFGHGEFTPPFFPRHGDSPRITLGGHGLRIGNLDLGGAITFGGDRQPHFDLSAIFRGDRGGNWGDRGGNWGGGNWGGGNRDWDRGGDNGGFTCQPTATACNRDYQDLKYANRETRRRSFNENYARNSSRTNRHAPPRWNA